jgi:L-serine dehydratase
MSVSVFDLVKVGIGPSSSHTVGPMRAARTFVDGLAAEGLLSRLAMVRAELFGSLGATGHGHGSPKAVMIGLEGETPEAVLPDTIDRTLARIDRTGQVRVLGKHEIAFDASEHVVMHRRKRLPFHSNGMTFAAWDRHGALLRERTYYSVGGGFVVDETATGSDRVVADTTEPSYPFHTGAELLALARSTGLSISSLMLANETAWRSEDQVRGRLLEIWSVMRDCVVRGCATDGVLPGGLKVRRRAPGLLQELQKRGDDGDPLHALEWVTLYALAVNEENAAGGRVVTAPTNGAAGIVPAVLHYYHRFVPGADDDATVRFLLAAGAVGSLVKENASISGAEVGCQGEVGSASAMAAAGLAEVLGGTPEQVENAAEIAMEHNLGLTCDPIGGLVQIPCIERNAVGAVKAITAARMAMHGDGAHHVSLDKVIRTMRQTGADMKDKYKETSRGGLAVNIIEC